MPAWCRHLTMSVRCLQDFFDHHGAAKCGKSARCMYECCHYREGLARYCLRCMCCTLAMSARCKDYLAISLQCLYDSTVILLSSHCCLANILRQHVFVFQIRQYGASSFVTACTNIWNCRAMPFCWPLTARRGLPTKNRAGAAYL